MWSEGPTLRNGKLKSNYCDFNLIIKLNFPNLQPLKIRKGKERSLQEPAAPVALIDTACWESPLFKTRLAEPDSATRPRGFKAHREPLLSARAGLWWNFATRSQHRLLPRCNGRNHSRFITPAAAAEPFRFQWRNWSIAVIICKLKTRLERCISQSWRKNSLWEFKGLFILLKLKTNKKTIRLIEMNGVSSLMVSVVDGGLKYKYKNKKFK